MAVALAAAHRAGVVHGDVAATNILFAASGAPLLCDFAGRGSVADDVAALGAVCHEALTGRPPDGSALAGRPGIPLRLAEVVDQARGGQFASCDELARALSSAMERAARPLTRTYGPRPPSPPLPIRRRRRGLVVAALVALVLVVAGGGVAAAVLDPEPPPASAVMRACPAVARPSPPAGGRARSRRP